MKQWKYPLYSVVRVNKKANKDMEDTVGLYGIVVYHLNTGLYDYEIQLEGNHPNGKFKEEELDYFFEVEGDIQVANSGKKAKVVTFDINLKQLEVYHEDGSYKVYLFGQITPLNDENNEDIMKDFEQIGQIVGRLVDEKQIAYGDSVSKVSKIMRVLLQKYKNEDNTYTIPDELLDHMLLTVRELDKINRYFTNPKGDLMEENPYQDKVGYNLLGMRMYEKLRKEAK